MSSNDFLGMTLPETSILKLSDYEDMYEKAVEMSNMAILSHLDAHGTETPENLQRAFPEIRERLKDLHRVGLVRRHSTDEYQITPMGSTIATLGAKEGVRQCMENEWEFEQVYSS